MLYRRLVSFVLLLATLSVFACTEDSDPTPAEPPAEDSPAASEIDPLLYPPAPEDEAAFRPQRFTGSADPIVLPDCRLTVFRKQDVASQRDGVLLVVGSPLQPGERDGSGRQFQAEVGGKLRAFRCLREDEAVAQGQLLAWVDDRIARDDRDMKRLASV